VAGVAAVEFTQLRDRLKAHDDRHTTFAPTGGRCPVKQMPRRNVSPSEAHPQKKKGEEEKMAVTKSRENLALEVAVLEVTLQGLTPAQRQRLGLTLDALTPEQKQRLVALRAARRPVPRATATLTKSAEKEKRAEKLRSA
jgi:hypothetical protein